MKKFWKNIVRKYNFLGIEKEQRTASTRDRYELAKYLIELRITAISYFRDFCLILLGIFSAAFGVKGFLLTNKLIDGGATGISLLTNAVTGVPLWIMLILINIPFILLGSKIVGREFAIKTSMAISVFALVIATVEFPNVTDDKLLVAIFGGFFLGAGIGLSVRGGAVIDGTEVLAIYLSRKFGTTIGDIIGIINISIFCVAAYFLSIEIELYSMITYLSASKTLDFVVEGIEEYMGVTIVSSHSEDFAKMIISDMERGVTVYSGKRGYGKKGETKDTNIIYSVITRLELNKLNTEIKKIDPNAFVVINSVKDTHGGMIKKRRLKHEEII